MCDLTFSAITFLLNKNTCGRFLFFGEGGGKAGRRRSAGLLFDDITAPRCESGRLE